MHRQVLETKLVLNRPRGPKGPLRVAECLVGDESGVIIFTAKNEQGAGYFRDYRWSGSFSSGTSPFRSQLISAEKVPT